MSATNSAMVWECLQKLNDLGKEQYSSSPVHVGNKNADVLAKNGASIPFVVPEPFFKLGKRRLQDVTQKR